MTLQIDLNLENYSYQNICSLMARTWIKVAFDGSSILNISKLLSYYFETSSLYHRYGEN